MARASIHACLTIRWARELRTWDCEIGAGAAGIHEVATEHTATEKS